MLVCCFLTSKLFVVPLGLSTYLGVGFFATDMIFSTALVWMKFLFEVRPITGFSSFLGTGGRLASGLGLSNFEAEIEGMS